MVHIVLSLFLIAGWSSVEIYLVWAWFQHFDIRKLESEEIIPYKYVLWAHEACSLCILGGAKMQLPDISHLPGEEEGAWMNFCTVFYSMHPTTWRWLGSGVRMWISKPWPPVPPREVTFIVPNLCLFPFFPPFYGNTVVCCSQPWGWNLNEVRQPKHDV